ncbi:marvel domain-containing protein [Pseudomassariella vexata]|uniref:Marvel domain-containing protein n=1 Tax=Pseudomassariella vexata TaxID=1141098 RepID=A0A1Y2EA12_9PEZI|nr:marvel domain-containing protein [Pseudomassariella vexata]ORY68382.1 marvel domain-containing protein [Pseudomassariella vexata]
MISVAAMGVRGFLLLFSAVVLALSVSVAKEQRFEAVPTQTSFSSFVGAFGLVVSAIGLLALWLNRIPALFVMGADVVTSIFFLAAGIALTLGLKSVSNCTDTSDQALLNKYDNRLVNGGCISRHGDTFCNVAKNEDDTKFSLAVSRCQRLQADYVFEYLGFILGIVMIGLGWMLHKRGGTSRATYV